MGNQSDTNLQHDDAAVSGRREILKAGLALATLPILAATSAGALAAETQTGTDAIMNDTEAKTFIDNMAEMMSHSSRSPILRRPDEYGLEYEDIFFPSLDGVPLEGWFIPADSDRRHRFLALRQVPPSQPRTRSCSGSRAPTSASRATTTSTSIPK